MSQPFISPRRLRCLTLYLLLTLAIVLLAFNLIVGLKPSNAAPNVQQTPTSVPTVIVSPTITVTVTPKASPTKTSNKNPTPTPTKSGSPKP